MAELVRLAKSAKELLDKAPDKYGPDSFSEECPCAVCEFRRAASPDAVLALVTVGLREGDGSLPPSGNGDSNG